VRTIVHLVALSTEEGPGNAPHAPFNVIYDGDLDEGQVRAAQAQQAPLQLGEERFLIREIGYDAISGETVLDVEAVPYLPAAEGR
jgi:hypothetical protein